MYQHRIVVVPCSEGPQKLAVLLDNLKNGEGWDPIAFESTLANPPQPRQEQVELATATDLSARLIGQAHTPAPQPVPVWFIVLRRKVADTVPVNGSEGLLPRQARCPCGSGKKYRACCKPGRHAHE